MNPVAVLAGLGALALLLGGKRASADVPSLPTPPQTTPPLPAPPGPGPQIPVPGTEAYTHYVPGTTTLLKEGYAGPEVAELQGILNSYGNTLVTNGKFGPSTTTAVKTFQSTHWDSTGTKLAVDGVVGPKTWWSLRNSPYGNDAYNYGSTAAPPTTVATNEPNPWDVALGSISGTANGEADVGYLQALELTAHLEAAPKYKEDKRAVAAYQAAVGLPPNGKYGPGTALKVASCGVVPVPPYYWSKGTAATQKAHYCACIAKCSQLYPEQDWQSALIERQS